MEFHTVTNKQGESFQATHINSEYYRRFWISFTGGEQAARDYLQQWDCYHEWNVIYEVFPSGLCIPLIRVDKNTLQ